MTFYNDVVDIFRPIFEKLPLFERKNKQVPVSEEAVI